MKKYFLPLSHSGIYVHLASEIAFLVGLIISDIQLYYLFTSLCYLTNLFENIRMRGVVTYLCFQTLGSV